MPAASFRVVLAPEAESDLYEILDYWTERDEAWRGEKYFHDLTHFALQELSQPDLAHRGRPLKRRLPGSVREVLAFGTYRIIYQFDTSDAVVEVLRFWHAHRAPPPFES